MYSSHNTHQGDESSPHVERPSLVEVVEQSSVHLRRAGKELVGLCPFHDEKTPSFYVNPTKEVEVFYCHGCGAKGDVFGYVMQIQGVDFKGALAHLGLASTPRRLKPMKPPRAGSSGSHGCLGRENVFSSEF